MHHMTGMSGRVSLMIDPSVKGIFDERPGAESHHKGEGHQPRPAAQHEYFPKDKEDNCQRIADKGEPVIRRSKAESGDALGGVFQRWSKVVECYIYKFHLAGGEPVLIDLKL